MTRTGLLNLLIGKSVLELVMVSSIAVGFYVVALPPYFHGWGEATTHSIAGWAVNNNKPWDRVEIQLFVDGAFVRDGTANLSRPDVVEAGWARDEWHGYSFTNVSFNEGVHEARVYALHESGRGSRRTLQLLGDPIRFIVRSDGTFVDISKASGNN
jgi:hypothetical protein